MWFQNGSLVFRASGMNASHCEEVHALWTSFLFCYVKAHSSMQGECDVSTPTLLFKDIYSSLTRCFSSTAQTETVRWDAGQEVHFNLYITSMMGIQSLDCRTLLLELQSLSRWVWDNDSNFRNTRKVFYTIRMHNNDNVIFDNFNAFLL